MDFVNYISSAAIPFIILLIVSYGIVENKKIFDVFLYGAKDGMEIVIRIFPTLVGLFVAIGLLRSSGIVDLIVKIIYPIIKIPIEIMPLAILRPISGSASIAVGTKIMTQYGVDSKIGLIISIISTVSFICSMIESIGL